MTAASLDALRCAWDYDTSTPLKYCECGNAVYINPPLCPTRVAALAEERDALKEDREKCGVDYVELTALRDADIVTLATTSHALGIAEKALEKISAMDAYEQMKLCAAGEADDALREIAGAKGNPNE